MDDRCLAILIASSKFPDEPSLTGLRCPENDVKGLSEVLKSPEIGGFQETHVFCNEPVHKVRTAINRVLGDAKKNDLVLIYYSGHGKQSKNGHLCLTMTDTKLDTLESSSIRCAEIREYIENSNCKSVVLILDCCFSGLVGGDFLRGGADDELHDISNSSGIFIMTASTGVQMAQEKEKDQYGVFTKHIIQGLKSGEADLDGDGKVSVDELYDYVEQKVREEDFQRPMKWDFNVKGSLFVGKTGRDPRSEWGQKVRENLLDLSKQEILPDLVLTMALGVIKKRRDELTEIEQKYDKLLDELLAEPSHIRQFLDKWMSITPVPGKAPNLPEPKLTTKPDGPEVRTKVHAEAETAAPQLVTTPKKRMDFGKIEADSDPPSRLLRIKNAGEGELKWRHRIRGKWIYATHLIQGLDIFLGTSEEGDLNGKVVIESNGGKATIDVHAQIVRSKKTRRPRKAPEISPGKWQIKCKVRTWKLDLDPTGRFSGIEKSWSSKEPKEKVKGTWSYNRHTKILFLKGQEEPPPLVLLGYLQIKITGKLENGFQGTAVSDFHFLDSDPAYNIYTLTRLN